MNTKKWTCLFDMLFSTSTIITSSLLSQNNVHNCKLITLLYIYFFTIVSIFTCTCTPNKSSKCLPWQTEKNYKTEKQYYVATDMST